MSSFLLSLVMTFFRRDFFPWLLAVLLRYGNTIRENHVGSVLWNDVTEHHHKEGCSDWLIRSGVPRIDSNTVCTKYFVLVESNSI